MLRSLHMSRSLHMAALCPGGALCSPSPLPPPTSLRCTSQQEDDYDDEAETTDGVDNIDYADDEEDDDEDVGSEDRKAKLEVPHAPPSRPRLVAPRLVDRAARPAPYARARPSTCARRDSGRRSRPRPRPARRRRCKPL